MPIPHSYYNCYCHQILIIESRIVFDASLVIMDNIMSEFAKHAYFILSSLGTSKNQFPWIMESTSFKIAANKISVQTKDGSGNKNV